MVHVWYVLSKSKRVAIITLAIFLAGCSQSKGPDYQKPKLVVSLPVVANIVHSLISVMPDCQISLMAINTAASSHHFEITPSIAAHLQASNALVIVGYPLDYWLTFGLPSHIQVIQLSDIAASQKFVRVKKVHTNTHAHGGVPDPHFWLDPRQVKSLLLPLASKLQAQLPPQCDGQRLVNQAGVVASQLELLDDLTRSKLQHLRGKRVVATHDAFSFFVAYLKALGIPIQYNSLEPDYAGAKHMSQVLRQLAQPNTMVWDIPPFSFCKKLKHKVIGKCIHLDPMGVWRKTHLKPTGYDGFYRTFLEAFYQ